MVKKNEAGFVTRVGGQITALAVQDNVEDGATLTTNDKFSVRFIGISHVAEVASAKMTVIVRETATGEAYKKYLVISMTRSTRTTWAADRLLTIRQPTSVPTSSSR